MKKKLQLVSGLKWKPVFKTDKELREWQDQWTRNMKEDLDEQKHRRAESELAERDHFIG